jgi:cellulose synthase/poly-beta-1,6-N-acetylglucosamine synthase-like glycosyltransferase
VSFLIFFALSLYLLLQIAQLAVLWMYRDRTNSPPEEWPEISILVAARNEAENIGACMHALEALDYPREKLNILIGDDQSTDNTRDIIIDFIRNKPWFRLIDIVDEDTPLKAKARVMAQLDRHATGAYYLITDADVQVPVTWAKEMLLHFRSDTGVVSGTTMVHGNGPGAVNQEIDWAYFMGLLNIIAHSGVPATAVGNNMAVRSKAYWETGGYGTIRFSITEDYKLYQQICDKGWKWNNIISPRVLAFSAPISDWKTLLHQRKRWLTGGRELPWYWWGLFAIFGLFYFFLPLALVISPVKAIFFWCIKFVLQAAQITYIYHLLDRPKPNWLTLLRYEVYLIAITLATAVFTALPFPTVWKGRSYSGSDL